MNEIELRITAKIPKKNGIYNGLIIMVGGIIAGITVSYELFFAAFLGLGFAILSFSSYKTESKKANNLLALYRTEPIKVIELLQEEMESNLQAAQRKTLKAERGTRDRKDSEDDAIKYFKRANDNKELIELIKELHLIN